MKKYLKFASAAFGIIALVMMFFTQVVVKFTSDNAIGFRALVGGEYTKGFVAGNKFAAGNGSGLAGYILVGVGALIVLVTVLVPLFKEHDVLSAVVTGIGVICMIVGTILIFLIRRSFATANMLDSEKVYVGWAAIAAGSLASLGAASGALGIVFDLAGN